MQDHGGENTPQRPPRSLGQSVGLFAQQAQIEAEAQGGKRAVYRSLQRFSAARATLQQTVHAVEHSAFKARACQSPITAREPGKVALDQGNDASEDRKSTRL